MKINFKLIFTFVTNFENENLFSSYICKGFFNCFTILIEEKLDLDNN